LNAQNRGITAIITVVPWSKSNINCRCQIRPKWTNVLYRSSFTTSVVTKSAALLTTSQPLPMLLLFVQYSNISLSMFASLRRRCPLRLHRDARESDGQRVHSQFPRLQGPRTMEIWNQMGWKYEITSNGNV